MENSTKPITAVSSNIPAFPPETNPGQGSHDHALENKQIPQKISDSDEIRKSDNAIDILSHEASISSQPKSDDILITCKESLTQGKNVDVPISTAQTDKIPRLSKLRKIPDETPSPSEMKKFSAMEAVIMDEFHDVISDQLTPSRRIAGPPAEIVFKQGIEVKPIHISIARPVPIHLRAEADKTLEKYIREGVLVPVGFPTEWLSPGMWVQKSDKKSGLLFP